MFKPASPTTFVLFIISTGVTRWIVSEYVLLGAIFQNLGTYLTAHPIDYCISKKNKQTKLCPISFSFADLYNSHVPYQKHNSTLILTFLFLFHPFTHSCMRICFIPLCVSNYPFIHPSIYLSIHPSSHLPIIVLSAGLSSAHLISANYLSTCMAVVVYLHGLCQWCLAH